MSEKLSSLSENPNTQMTQKEIQILDKFFPINEGSFLKNDDSKGWKNSLKLALYSSVIFILLSNPFTDGILGGISYFTNSLNLIIFKILLFLVLFVIMYKYFFKFA